MLFVSVEDFYEHVERLPRLRIEEEEALWKQGDADAREKLVQGYLPFVAGMIRRTSGQVQTLKTVYACIACTEKCVANFDHNRGRREFVHQLGWRLRQCIIRCIAER